MPNPNLIKERYWRKFSGKENPRKTKSNVIGCKKMKRVKLTAQSWKEKHMTEKFGVTEKKPDLG